MDCSAVHIHLDQKRLHERCISSPTTAQFLNFSSTPPLPLEVIRVLTLANSHYYSTSILPPCPSHESFDCCCSFWLIRRGFSDTSLSKVEFYSIKPLFIVHALMCHHYERHYGDPNENIPSYDTYFCNILSEPSRFLIAISNTPSRICARALIEATAHDNRLQQIYFSTHMAANTYRFLRILYVSN